VKVDFKKSFTKDLKKVKDQELLQQVKAAIEEIEQAPSLQTVSSLKQLKGGGGYFRVRIGDHRIGLKLEGDTVIFVRFLHRKEIYRYFP
jgi:mRNA interferase RelE/StbE